MEAGTTRAPQFARCVAPAAPTRNSPTCCVLCSSCEDNELIAVGVHSSLRKLSRPNNQDILVWCGPLVQGSRHKHGFRGDKCFRDSLDEFLHARPAGMGKCSAALRSTKGQGCKSRSESEMAEPRVNCNGWASAGRLPCRNAMLCRMEQQLSSLTQQRH